MMKTDDARRSCDTIIQEFEARNNPVDAAPLKLLGLVVYLLADLVDAARKRAEPKAKRVEP